MSEPAADTTLVLLGYPVELGLREREHLAEVLRELQLLSIGATPENPRVPAQLPAGMPQLPPGVHLPKGFPQLPGGPNPLGLPKSGPDPFGLNRPKG